MKAREAAILSVLALVAAIHISVALRSPESAGIFDVFYRFMLAWSGLLAIAAWMVLAAILVRRLADENAEQSREAILLLASGAAFAVILHKLADFSDLTTFYEVEATAALAIFLAFALGKRSDSTPP